MHSKLAETQKSCRILSAQSITSASSKCYNGITIQNDQQDCRSNVFRFDINALKTISSKMQRQKSYCIQIVRIETGESWQYILMVTLNWDETLSRYKF